MSADGVHFRLEVENAALVALFMVHEAIFEANFSLSVKDMVLGLSARSDGFRGDVLVSSLIFLVTFHLLEFFLD